VEHLLKVVRIKQLCRQANVEKVEAGPKGATLAFRGNRFADPGGLVALIAESRGAAKLRPDHKLVYIRDWETPADRLKGVAELLERLARLATPAYSAA
jgi:transcription-repair coupling factor (superfamily II helicase)